MITAQRLLTELGRRAWSGFNADDMVFNSDDSAQARAELNSALRYLINLEDFPFKTKETTLMAMRNISNYSMPDGQINSVYNKNTLKELDYISDNSEYDKTLKGQPTSFWVENSNPSESLRLYPIPDSKYNYTIVFNQYKPIISVSGETSYEFENENDYINMPEKLDYLFMDCLVMRTMIQNNKDEQDENYKPMINEFNEVWRVFKKACNPVQLETRVVW